MSSKNKTTLIRDWDEVYLFSVSSDSRGIAILFNGKLDYKVLSEEEDVLDNFLRREIELGKVNLLLAVIYSPNQDFPEFYNDLQKTFWHKTIFGNSMWVLELSVGLQNDTH